MASSTTIPGVRHAAFVFTDIVGSTALAETAGDARWARALRRHNALVRAATARHGGEEVAFLGDGFLLMFGSVHAAWDCAADIQHALAEAGAIGGEPVIAVRIGIHAGTAVRDGRDVIGRAVHLAHRIAGQAGAGEIALSDRCRAALAGTSSDGLRWERRDVTLRGLAGRHAVHVTRSRSVPAMVA